ncbi:MAG: FAD-binding protein, partial [Chloroflexota bacterium]
VVTRAIYREALEGRGSEHGGAYLDISHRPADFIKSKLPSMYEQFRALADVDITRGPMEIAPTVHYAMGGVRVEAETGATTVPGLFAAGEVAAGLHGSNRLGGNSLTDLLVFGRRAGEAAAQHATGVELPRIDMQQVQEEKHLLLRPFESGGNENPYLLHQELQDVMSEHAGIARDEASMSQGLQKVLELQERSGRIDVRGSRMFNPAWHMARDDLFMLTVAEAVMRAAIERKESRGAHYRTDFPDKDPALESVNFIVCKSERGMQLQPAPIPPLPAELAAVLKETS